MPRSVYLICPVRNVSPEVSTATALYVAGLEAQGYKVHYPPRDVDQTNDDGGIRIVAQHLIAMMLCNEVHVWWDDKSYGCHFDLGMAAMLMVIQHVRAMQTPKAENLPILKIVSANNVQLVPEKSFQNVLYAMCMQSLPFTPEKQEAKTGAD